MDCSASCSCVCRFLGRYTKVVAVSPQHSTLSRQAQALEFCNVCVSDTTTNDEVPSTNPAEWTLRTFTSHPFFKDLFLLAVGRPFIFFLCLTPLWFADGAIYEAWRMYYLFWMFLASSLFGRNLMVVSWGRGPRLRTVFISAAFTSICCTAIAVASCKSAVISFSVDVTAVFVLLYLPALHILRVRSETHYDTTTFVLYLTGISAGAVPCGVSASLYYYTLAGSASERIGMVICLVVWVFSSALVKSIGKRIWTHAAPTCTIFGPILWVFFVEVAMNCLGIRVFFSSTWSALLLSTSFLVTAATQLYKGTETCFGTKPISETIGVHRLTILLETFASCVGRLAALTIYVCFTSLQITADKKAEDIRRTMPSMFGGQMTMINSIDAYRNSNVDASKPWMGIIGMIEILFIFAGFTAQASRWWTAGSAVKVKIKVAPGQTDAHELPPVLSGSHGDCAEISVAGDPAVSARVSAVAVQRPGRWWDELYLGETRMHQLDLLSAFVTQYWSHLLSIVSFVFALSTLLVSTADRFRHGFAGMPNC